MVTDVPYQPGNPWATSTLPPPFGEPSVTEAMVLTAVGKFCEAILPDAIEVMAGQANRVPQPTRANFVIMTPGSRAQLSTTTRTWTPPAPSGVGGIVIQQSTRFDMQIDVYGPASAEAAQLFVMLWRDAFGCEFLKPYGVQPLYCLDASQLPLVDGEQQYEQRWTITASMQINPSVSTPAQFADSVTVELIQADQG